MRHEALTPRECEILRLCGEGLRPKKIAERLHISKRTVDFHLQHIYFKLDVGSVIAAVAAVADIRWPDEFALPKEAHHARTIPL